MIHLLSALIPALALAPALAPPSPPPPAPADTVVGRWKTPAHNGVVEIARCGASICGRIVASDKLRTEPNLKDANNTDVSLRGRNLRGLQILGGFTRDGDAWSNGKIYNAEDGKTYNAKITPVGADQLKLRGCVFFPLCKTQTWTRVR